ncbi:uncharacterized protein ACA1_072280, partial [Acanthamoeba castellanii str. Neff]
QREDGEWGQLEPGAPLYIHGLRRSGQRMSISSDSHDVDFHNLDRHTLDQLRWVYEHHWGDFDPAWSKQQLIKVLSGSSTQSQFENPIANQRRNQQARLTAMRS